MDGIFFYWFGWIYWIMVTFLMPKNRHRNMFAIWILVTIALSQVYLSIAYVDLSLSYLMILIGSMLLLAKQNPIGLAAFSAFTIMIGYSSLLIWESVAPVWLFLPRLIIIPFLCVLVTVIMAKGFLHRLAISALGLCGGELLYNLMLAGYSLHQTVGSFVFLDVLLIVSMLLVLLEGVQFAKNKLFLFLSRI